MPYPRLLVRCRSSFSSSAENLNWPVCRHSHHSRSICNTAEYLRRCRPVHTKHIINSTMRPHLSGSCPLCFHIKTGRVPKGSVLQVLHDAVIVFCALPTAQSSRTLLQILEGLHIGTDHPKAILYLLKEVLQYLHPQNADLERIKAIGSEVRLVPDPSQPGEAPTCSIIQSSTQENAIETAYIVRRALIPSLQARAGPLGPLESIQVPEQRSNLVTATPSTAKSARMNQSKTEPATTARSKTQSAKHGVHKRRARGKARQTPDAGISEQRTDRRAKVAKADNARSMLEEQPAQERTKRDAEPSHPRSVFIGAIRRPRRYT